MKALWRAARITVVLQYLGRLSLVMAVVFAVPMVIALVNGDVDIGLRYLVVAGGLAVCGALSRRWPEVRIQRNEGMAIAGLTFVLASVLATYPLTGTGLSWVDALFEAVSGVTTTGLSTLASLGDHTDSFLFARAWAQWCGGLGIVVLALALLQNPGAVAVDLAVTEDAAEDYLGSARTYARRVFLIYGCITAAGIAALAATGLTPAEAVEFAMAAVSTGGFAPRDDSVAGIGGLSATVVTSLCLAGAVPLLLYSPTHHRRKGRRASLVEATALLCSLTLVSAALGLLLVRSGAAWSDAAGDAVLLAASAQSTAGFSALDLGDLDNPSKLVLILAMFAGGCSGSTAGGFKMIRLLIFAGVLLILIARAALPKHAVAETRVAGQVIGPARIQDVLTMLGLSLAVTMASWLAFLTAGYDPLDSLFEVVSATNTVGLSAGITSAELPAFLKLVLCGDMLLGRLEFAVWIVILSPRTWTGRIVARSERRV